MAQFAWVVIVNYCNSSQGFFVDLEVFFFSLTLVWSDYSLSHNLSIDFRGGLCEVKK